MANDKPDSPPVNNMAVWDAVKTVDPKYTKGFNRSGGFKGTSTNATYLASLATKMFGPCGIGWGIHVVGEQMIEGHPFIENGVVVGYTKVHVARVRLWYVLGGQTGEIEQYGQTEMVGKNSRGYFTDEEAPKKSITDGMTKCLSLLGFAAEIHMGMYDDNKYVNDVRQRFAEERGEEQPPPERDSPVPRETPKRDLGRRLTVAEHFKAIREAESVPILKSAFGLAWKQYENPADPKDVTESQAKFKQEYDKQLSALTTQPTTVVD